MTEVKVNGIECEVYDEGWKIAVECDAKATRAEARAIVKAACEAAEIDPNGVTHVYFHGETSYEWYMEIL